MGIFSKSGVAKASSRIINKEEIKKQILKFLQQHPSGSDTFTAFLSIKNAEVTYEEAKALCKELEDDGYIGTSESDDSIRNKVLIYSISITDKGKSMDEPGGSTLPIKMVAKEKKKRR